MEHKKKVFDPTAFGKKSPQLDKLVEVLDENPQYIRRASHILNHFFKSIKSLEVVTMDVTMKTFMANLIFEHHVDIVNGWQESIVRCAVITIMKMRMVKIKTDLAMQLKGNAFPTISRIPRSTSTMNSFYSSCVHDT